MESITLLKKRNAYPSDGPPTVVWEPVATVQGTVERLPGDGLQVTVPFGATGQRVEYQGRQYEIVRASDWAQRGERLIMVLSPVEA